MKQMMILWVVLLGISATGKSQTVAKPSSGKFALGIEGSDREAGIHLQYAVRDRWYIPVSVGICNGFNERKWNDRYMDIAPYYLFGKGKWRFPLGVVGGMRFLKDYGSRFTAFYGGIYGGTLYRCRQHGIGIDVGAKYGKKYHLLEQSAEWGSVAASETYREKPFFFKIYYRFYF